MKKLNVKKSGIINSFTRIDASFHLSEGRIAKKKILSSPYELRTINQIAERIFFGSIFKRTFVKNLNHGIPYLTSSDMIKSDLNTNRYLSKALT